MINNILAAFLFLTSTVMQAQNILPAVASGKIERLENFSSEYVQSRNVDVWLPDNYNGTKKFSVIYIHDGQMLFDANTTWNTQKGKADEVISELIENKKIENCIVVAIWNTGKDRMMEYFPQKIFDNVSPEIKKIFQKKYNFSKPDSDDYLSFLVNELKPYIDNKYFVKTDRDNTFLIGSSLGGLISLYAISEYPKVFGGAACLSTNWPGDISQAIRNAVCNYLNENSASSMEHKLYFDYETNEIKPDPYSASFQYGIDSVCIAKGFQKDINFKTEIITNGDQNEASWLHRLHRSFEFLLPKKQNQQADFGKIDLYEDFTSAYVSERNIEVWLPENYSKEKKYSVLYMNDGQMLFDAETSWNKQTWDVDRIAQKLINEQKTKDFIVVGIWNAGNKRHENYFPQKPYEMLSAVQKDTITAQLQKMGRTKDVFRPDSDNYLRFLVTELKPFIDKQYATNTKKEDTFIAGSSMGGLISMYAICEYPEVFGGAACLSTHWPGIFNVEGNPIPDAFARYIKMHLPGTDHKIYFDYGDQTLDALYPPLQQKIDAVMQEKGFTDKNWITRYFPGQDHSEKSWSSRLNIPLTFLFSNTTRFQTEIFEPLPFGSVKPSGWLKAQMQKDVEGFIGNLDQIVPTLINDPIYSTGRLHKNSKEKDLGNNKEGDAEGSEQYKWWNSETQSNWWDGYLRNVILLNDESGIKKVHKYVDGILSTQDKDGYIGIYDEELRYKFNTENGELWSKATLYRGLLAYYEYTKDERVFKAVERAVENVMQNYPIHESSPFNSGTSFNGGVSHGLTFTDVLEKLFFLTKNEKYRAYSLFLYYDFSNTYQSEADVQLKNISDPNYKLKSHAVHTFEHLRTLIIAKYTARNHELSRALETYLERIKNVTTISGGAIGDEWIAERNADATHTGYEYCSLQELLDSYSMLYQKTGDSSIGDQIENTFYNAAQGSRNPNHSCIAYLKTDNSFEMLGTKNGEEEHDRKQTRYKYSAAHQDVAVCCNPNAGRISPYFIQSSWMKENESTLVATLLMPNVLETSINGGHIRIENITEYPFKNKFRFKITQAEPSKLIIKIRKPSWVKKVTTNEKFSIENNFIVISREFKDIDNIKISFETDIQIKTDNTDKNYFTYGALLFAKPISATEITGKNYTKNFTDFTYKPDPLIKYSFFNNTKATYKKGKIHTQLVNQTLYKLESVELIPMGNTILRQVSF
jgi:predicted alpha/beta superfamily hydrolase/DUF1680 family protein